MSAPLRLSPTAFEQWLFQHAGHWEELWPITEWTLLGFRCRKCGTEATCEAAEFQKNRALVAFRNKVMTGARGMRKD